MPGSSWPRPSRLRVTEMLGRSSWLILITAIALQGCTTVQTSCAGGPLRLSDGRAAQSVEPLEAAENVLSFRPTSELSCLAMEGGQYAQFIMGHAYENGIAVQRSLGLAADFYRMAARDRIGSRAVYSAPIGSESAGTTIMIPGQVILHGLPEAEIALARLETGR